MNGSALHVAVAGAGWVSRHHLDAWRRTAGAHVVALCDPDLRRADALAAEFGIARTFADARAMLEQVRPDALDIAASLAAHEPLCLLAAEQGVHVLCQKPLAESHEKAGRIVAALERRVRLMVHENWRFRPQYRRMRGWIDAGEIGAPLACQVRVRSSGLWPDANGVCAQIVRQPFFATQPRLLVAEVLVHHLDVIRWFLGGLEVVAARSARVSPAIEGEDIASILLARGERWALLDGNLASPGRPSKTHDAFELIGSGGIASFDADVVRLRGRARSEDVGLDPQQAYADSYAGAIGHFANALIEGVAFESAPEDHLEVLAQMEAAYAAMRRPLDREAVKAEEGAIS